MARVFLFYTGYYQKTELPLAGGGTITKAQVINWIDDVVANSGASLVPEFRNMWPYSIKEETNYGFARDNNLEWVTDAGNTESIFEIAFVGLQTSDWGTNNFYNNTVNLFCGHRDSEAKRPFGHGWGFAPVNPNLYSSWSDLDIRKRGSVWNVNDATEGTDSYLFGADMQWHETNLWEKKYIPINIAYNGGNVNYSVKLYGSKNDIQLDNTQNIVLLRLADVLLMGAELGSSHAQAYMDMVRSRVGLPSVAPTLENIQAERRHELAFEGIRYFDLLRWYGKEAGVVIQQNEKDASIFNMTVATTINQSDNGLWSNIAQRVRDTGGFLMIPEDQINLSGGVLLQNAGWTSSGDIYY
jgi:hypothetical protein